MTDTPINPKVAAALMVADAEIVVKKRGKKKYGFKVSVGPYTVAEGTCSDKQTAIDDAATALESTMRYLRSLAGSA